MKILSNGFVPARPTEKAGEMSAEFKEKCKEFESLLINEMIAAMEPKGGFFGKGFGGEYFGTMFRQEMAKELSKQLDLGLKTQLAKGQIKEKEFLGK